KSTNSISSPISRTHARTPLVAIHATSGVHSKTIPKHMAQIKERRTNTLTLARRRERATPRIYWLFGALPRGTGALGLARPSGAHSGADHDQRMPNQVKLSSRN